MNCAPRSSASFVAPATKIAQLANAPAAKVARVIQAYASKSAALRDGSQAISLVRTDRN